MRKLIVLTVLAMTFGMLAGGVASAESDGVADSDMRQITDIGEAEPNTTLTRKRSVTFCYEISSFYGKQLYLSVYGECGELAPLSLTFPTTSTVKVCASKYTGYLYYMSNSFFSCTPAFYTHVFPQDGSLPYCGNLFTKIVKVNYSGNACGGSHTEGVIYP